MMKRHNKYNNDGSKIQKLKELKSKHLYKVTIRTLVMYTVENNTRKTKTVEIR